MMSPPLVEIEKGMRNNNFRHSFKSKKEEMNILSKGVPVDFSKLLTFVPHIHPQ